MSNEDCEAHADDCESAYRAGWRAAGAAIAERIAGERDSVGLEDEWAGGYYDGLDRAEEIARNEVRGE